MTGLQLAFAVRKGFSCIYIKWESLLHAENN